MGRTQRYFKRIGYVSIQGSDGMMHDYGDSVLDFRFSGEKVGGVYTDFQVGILGLNSATINDLTVWDAAKAIAASRRIEVYAGYEDGGIEHPLFEGIIVEAMPTNPPEMWMNFKCLNLAGGSASAERANRQLKQVEIGTLFGWIARDCGFGGRSQWKVTDVEPTDKVDFVYMDSSKENVKAFEDAFGLTVYEDGGILYAIGSRPQMDEPSDPITEVNQDTGMLALGNITLAGATIKTRLSDKAGLMSWINLTSKIVPKANGKYVVVRKRHVGHFRGEEWYTELETIRQGAKV